MRRLLLLIALFVTIADCAVLLSAEPQSPVPCSCWCSRKLCGVFICC